MESQLFIHSFARHAGLQPNAPAVGVGGQSYTYGQVARLSGGIAKAFPFPELTNPWVGILADENPRTFASMLACWSVGVGYVPLSPSQPLTRNASILRTAGSKLLLTGEKGDYARELASLVPGLEVVETLNLPPGEFRVEEKVNPHSPAYLLFTSGSTGRPKGVILSQECLSAFLFHLTRSGAYDFGPSDRFLMMFEPTFDASMVSFLTALSLGASFYVVPRSGLLNMNVFQTMEAHSITVANVVPSFLSYLRPWFGEMSLPSLRWFLSGGEPFPVDLAREWGLRCAPGAKIENVYGPTEATIFCHTHRFDSADPSMVSRQGQLPIGRPMSRVKAWVMDESLQPLPAGIPGEIILAGPQLALGYLNEADLTTRAFPVIDVKGRPTRVYRTGDQGLIDPSGRFHFMGRLDNQVKVDGFRIELGEVEFHARNILPGRTIAAFTQGGRIRLCVEGEPVNPSEFLGQLRLHLPAYMVPDRVIFVPSFPVQANGKIDRQCLRGLAGLNQA